MYASYLPTYLPTYLPIYFSICTLAYLHTLHARRRLHRMLLDSSCGKCLTNEKTTSISISFPFRCSRGKRYRFTESVFARSFCERSMRTQRCLLARAFRKCSKFSAEADDCTLKWCILASRAALFQSMHVGATFESPNMHTYICIEHVTGVHTCKPAGTDWKAVHTCWFLHADAEQMTIVQLNVNTLVGSCWL